MAYFSQKQVDRLSPANLDILEALARYRYLTSRQIIALGIVSQRSNLSRVTSRFEVFTKPLIERSRYSNPAPEGGGRRSKEDLLTLTKRGAEFLAQIEPDRDDDIRFVNSKGVSARDYDHTRETVDFHILLDQFAAMYGVKVDCFHTYHDHTGANAGRQAAQGIDLLRRQTTFTVPLRNASGGYSGEKMKFSADAVCHLTDPTGKGHLFAVEIQRGMDTKRLHKKLKDSYLPALEEGTLSYAYDVDYDAKALIICENPSLVTKTLERLEVDPDFNEFRGCFAFHTIADLQGTGAGFDIADNGATGQAWNLAKATRQQIAYALKDRPNWLQIMNDDSRYSAHPKRLARGWRFIGGKVGTIF